MPPKQKIHDQDLTRRFFMRDTLPSDPTARADVIASYMREWYDKNKPRTYWERKADDRVASSSVADDLMLGLSNVFQQYQDPAKQFIHPGRWFPLDVFGYPMILNPDGSWTSGHYGINGYRACEFCLARTSTTLRSCCAEGRADDKRKINKELELDGEAIGKKESTYSLEPIQPQGT